MPKIPEEGSLIKFQSKFTRAISYVRVDSFYDILESHGGGRGFNHTHLNGTGNGSIPESHIERVKKFKDLTEMQKDIDSGKQTIF